MTPMSPIYGIYHKMKDRHPPRYIKSEDENGGPFYIVQRADSLWTIKEGAGDSDEDGLYIICDDEWAPHPAATKKPWMSGNDETGEFEPNPTIAVKACSPPQ